MSTEESLKRWLDWVGTAQCVCRWEYKSMTGVYGGPRYKGWVRVNTDPRCLDHNNQGDISTVRGWSALYQGDPADPA